MPQCLKALYVSVRMCAVILTKHKQYDSWRRGGLENKSSVHSLHYDATGNVRDIQVAVASNTALAIPCLSHLSNAPRERTGRESMHSITSSAASHRDSETRKIICWTNGIKFSGGERLL